MNPWYQKLREEQSALHDYKCAYGAKCPTRERHIDASYMTAALRRLVEELRAAS